LAVQPRAHRRWLFSFGRADCRRRYPERASGSTGHDKPLTPPFLLAASGIAVRGTAVGAGDGRLSISLRCLNRTPRGFLPLAGLLHCPMPDAVAEVARELSAPSSRDGKVSGGDIVRRELSG